MKFKNGVLAGLLLSVGGLQWFFSIVIAERMHRGFNIAPSEWIPYSSTTHYISELGVGSTALIFNASLFLLGLVVAVSSFFLQRGYNSKIFSVLLLITGVGTMGVGLFPTIIQPTHGIFQFIAMLFGAFSAIISFRLQKSPISYVFVFLGVFSLVASVVFYPYLGLGLNDTVTYLGLGKGAMERLAIYPILVWVIGFGFYLMGGYERVPGAKR
jgi:hypothetical membrane protein